MLAFFTNSITKTPKPPTLCLIYQQFVYFSEVVSFSAEVVSIAAGMLSFISEVVSFSADELSFISEVVSFSAAMVSFSAEVLSFFADELSFGAALLSLSAAAVSLMAWLFLPPGGHEHDHSVVVLHPFGDALRLEVSVVGSIPEFRQDVGVLVHFLVDGPHIGPYASG